MRREAYTRVSASLQQLVPNDPGLDACLDRLARSITELQGWAHSLGWRPSFGLPQAQIESVLRRGEDVEVALLLAGYVDGDESTRLLRLACQECRLNLTAPPQVSLVTAARGRSMLPERSYA
jgi:hypothetical protein